MVRIVPAGGGRVRATSVVLGWLLCICGSCAAHAVDEQVLYLVKNSALVDGKFGNIYAMQNALNRRLKACGMPAIGVDGTFGYKTSGAIKRLSSCDQLPEDLRPTYKSGLLTAAVWQDLMPTRPLPPAAYRAQTLVSTFERLDFDGIEWNFCQNKPFWNPIRPSMTCYTNDPASLLTWGPRGATAGGGKEIQWIISRVDVTHSKAIDAAFGPYAPEIRKLAMLDTRSSKAFLCAVYSNDVLRKAWNEGFAKFGSDAVVRSEYMKHYASYDSDGKKIKAYYDLYRRLGLEPTEVDYGFFLDRATHASMGSDIGAMADRIQSLLKADDIPVTSPNVRRAIAKLFYSSNRQMDRLGRDVTFFVDAVTVARLDSNERVAWVQRLALSASDAGLSDARRAPPLVVELSIAKPTFSMRLPQLPVCPAAIEHPIDPSKK